MGSLLVASEDALDELRAAVNAAIKSSSKSKFARRAVVDMKTLTAFLKDSRNTQPDILKRLRLAVGPLSDEDQAAMEERWIDEMRRTTPAEREALRAVLKVTRGEGP